jgi:diguanylate cyclase (GGDEF)-like protein/PAS domain S-box-containing protein
MFSPRPRVLVVDDNADNLRFLKDALGGDLELLCAAVAAEAVDIARATLPDITLFNLTPSYGDGSTSIAEFRQNISIQTHPCIAYAAVASEEIKSRALQAGATDILVLPTDAKALRLRIDAYIGRLVGTRLNLAEAIYQQVREAVMVTDLEDRIVDVNSAFCQLTGYSRDEVVGKTPAFLKSGRHDEEFYRSLWATLTKTGHWSGEIWNRMKNGELHPQLLTVTQVKDSAGNPTHYVGIWSDIRIIKNHLRKLERLAYYDPLTELPNRSLLEDRIHQAIAYTLRAGGLLGIGFLDIDGYRTISDRLGFEAGDQVLLEVAKRMTDLLRAGDTVARVGGDEFVFLLIGVENVEEAETITDRLIKLIAQPIALPQGEVTVTASVGLTFAPTDCINPGTLVRHADEAMVAAKTAGRNGFRVYQPSDESVGC